MIGISISPLRPKVLSAFDSAAAAFISAAGITNASQKTAINTLVVGLKANSLWTKSYALYPMVGGSATTHKFNLVNPTDSDAAFRLGFAGGWTHDATGALPNGTTGYADTYFTPSTSAISINSNAMFYYSGTNNTTAAIDFGVNGANTVKWAELIYTGGLSRAYPMTTATLIGAAYPSTTAGLFTLTRTASNATSLYHNGATVILNSTQAPAASKPDRKVYLGAYNNNGTAQDFTNRKCQFFGITDGLSSAETATLYTLLSAFQTALGR